MKKSKAKLFKKLLDKVENMSDDDVKEVFEKVKKEARLIRIYRIKKILYKIRKFIYKAWIYNCIFFMKECLMRLVQNWNRNLFGKVSFWMFVVYMNLAWLDDLLIPWMRKKGFCWVKQVLIIEGVIYIFEFTFGMFFKYVLKVLPWDYSHHKLFGIPVNLFGVISLYFVIPWFFIGMFLLWLYPRLKVSIDENIGKDYNMFRGKRC